MATEGGCYCKAVRYESTGKPTIKALCLCRECQHISGGAGNMLMVVPVDGFRYTKGAPKKFTRSDFPNAVTREFCGECGKHLTTRLPWDANAVVLKIGTLDDPAAYGGPKVVIWTSDKQKYHLVPEGVPTFEKSPG